MDSYESGQCLIIVSFDNNPVLKKTNTEVTLTLEELRNQAAMIPTDKMDTSIYSVTEELILKEGRNELKKITCLSLCDQGITDLDAAVMNKLISLKTLDLSANNIKEIPDDLSLTQLTTLGLADNLLSSVQFVENFPKLTRLEIYGNPSFGIAEKCIAVDLCKSLREVDDCKRSYLENIINTSRNKWETQIKALWEVLFAADHCNGIPDDKVSTILDDFISTIKKDQLYSVPTKLDDFTIKKIAIEIIDSVKSGKMFSPEKNVIGTPRSARIHQLRLNKTPTSSPNKSLMTTPQSRSGTPSNGTPSRKRQRESSPSSERKNEKRRRIDISDFNIEQLPVIPDYDPSFFVRCHSEDNSPTDETTKIWQCSFEPIVNVSDCRENIVATCGGNVVCLVDCQTGKVMKKYKDNKEYFYTLAWTSIPMDKKSKDKTNILAVAGDTGKIKLIHPSQLTTYATLTGHKKYISCLMFHPKEPTMLFSGSRDGTVYAWDIGIPDFTDYSTKHQKLATFKTGRLDIVGFGVSIQQNLLLAACEDGCIAWKLNSMSAKTAREPDIKFVLPTVDEEEMRDEEEEDQNQIVDSLLVLDNDTVVTKCVGDSCLHVWDLQSNLPKSSKTRSVAVTTKAMLQYRKVDTDFIYLGAQKNTVAVGDDNGNIHMYNMQDLTKKKSVKSDTILESSRVLEWPELSNGLPRESSPDSQNIVINCVCISADQKYIVCGTDNNLVCIWKKC